MSNGIKIQNKYKNSKHFTLVGSRHPSPVIVGRCYICGQKSKNEMVSGKIGTQKKNTNLECLSLLPQPARRQTTTAVAAALVQPEETTTEQTVAVAVAVAVVVAVAVTEQKRWRQHGRHCCNCQLAIAI